MQRVQLESAFVLHSIPYRNTSLIVDLLTRQFGRVSVVARSSRGPKSRYKGQLQAFVPLLVSYSGRHELKNLNQIELYSKPYDLLGNHMMCGFYLNELLVRLLHKEEACPQLFALYQQTLLELERGKHLERVLRIFEKRLLSQLGYGLALNTDASSGQAIESERSYRFVFERGFLEIDADIFESSVFSGSSLLALHNEALSNTAELHDAKRLMRLALSYYLGSKPLKSRELF